MHLHQQDNRSWWVITLLAWLGFLFIAVSLQIQSTWLSHFDQGIQRVTAMLQQPETTDFFKWFALLGTPTVNLLICLLVSWWLWGRHEHFAAGWVMTAQVGINILTGILKMVFQRPRPLGKLVAQGGFSFPSGHTTSTATMVLIIILIVLPFFHRLAWQVLLSIISLIWLCMMGFDRIYLFVHYPSDVLAGLCLALGWWGILRLSFGRAVPQQHD